MFHIPQRLVWSNLPSVPPPLPHGRFPVLHLLTPQEIAVYLHTSLLKVCLFRPPSPSSHPYPHLPQGSMDSLEPRMTGSDSEVGSVGTQEQSLRKVYGGGRAVEERARTRILKVVEEGRNKKNFKLLQSNLQ